MSYFNRLHASRPYRPPPPRVEPTSITPGELLQREGADQQPSPVVDDETARRVRRLLDLHCGTETEET